MLRVLPARLKPAGAVLVAPPPSTAYVTLTIVSVAVSPASASAAPASRSRVKSAPASFASSLSAPTTVGASLAPVRLMVKVLVTAAATPSHTVTVKLSVCASPAVRAFTLVLSGTYR